MPTRPLPFLLSVALVDDEPRPSLARWRAQARAAQAAGVDFVTIEAGPADAVLVAASVSASTASIGVVAAAPTTATEPFHVSTSIATVDEVSGGRAGWLATVLPAAEADGLVTWSVPADVHADAAEHIEVVRALWDSWEDGAEIRDAATARFIDRSRVHHIDLRGELIAVRGPSITPRPPQGHPPIAVRVRSARDLRLARDRADVAFFSRDTAPPPETDGLVRVLDLSAGDDLEPRIADAEAAGFDGVLVHTAELDATLATLAPTLAARDGSVVAPGSSLRERLGLGPAINRFAATT